MCSPCFTIYNDSKNVVVSFLNLSKIRKSFDQMNLKTLKEILHNPADI